MREEPSPGSHPSWKVPPLITIWRLSLKHMKLRGHTKATVMIFLSIALSSIVFSSPTQTSPPTSFPLGSAYSFQIQKPLCDYRNFQALYSFWCSTITFKWHFWLLKLEPRVAKVTLFFKKKCIYWRKCWSD